MCSPHPRGWSPLQGLGQEDGVVLPAPAGMVPTPGTDQGHRSRAPRTRGDGPAGPLSLGLVGRCSPHPRGWSQQIQAREEAARVLPAPAGMVPSMGTAGTWVASAPRTRGDGPKGSRGLHSLLRCSPHPRGWSPLGRALIAKTSVLPAPVGMVPSSCSRPGHRSRAPRTRGDGPRACEFTPSEPGCSPHPRGWSPRGERDRPRIGVLPAPAGMVPIWCPSGLRW